MVHLLGINLPDRLFTRHALTSFYGVGPYLAHRICARLQIHDRSKMRDLTPFQMTSLAAFLSSPKTSPLVPHYHTAGPEYNPPPATTSPTSLRLQFYKDTQARQDRKKEWFKKIYGETPKNPMKEWRDPLNNIKIESELRREIRDNIAHQKMIGSYVGRRHVMGLPVRGQNTQTNAKTARKLNRLERY